jgi:hypothetical protein
MKPLFALASLALSLLPAQALAQDLAGTWNGTYKWHYESSHTGSVKDSGGNTTATWGTASQDGETGHYQIRDTFIFFVSKRGEQGLAFRLWVEKGKPHMRIGNTTLVR